MEEEESTKEIEKVQDQPVSEGNEVEATVPVLERNLFLQEGRTDIEMEVEHQEKSSYSKDLEKEIWRGILKERSKAKDDSGIKSKLVDETDPQEGPSGSSSNLNSRIVANTQNDSQMDQISENVNNDIAATRLQRYGNYLERYGPHLERYGNQLERFGNQLERIGPHLERCGSNLERYGPQLEAIGRQLERTSTPQAENSCLIETERARTPLPNIHTQTESGNEGFTPQSADSCQGSSASQHTGRQGSWINPQNNPRRLSRRPSFQVNDGLIRHWMRRRNLDGREILPFRLRDDRRRSIWRNDGDLRDFRRVRGTIWRGQDNYFSRRQQQENIQNNDVEENNLGRSGGLQIINQQENGGHLLQEHVRIRRNEAIHQDDPNYGFVLIDHQNTSGPSRQDTSTSALPERRPRSHMSLRPLNVSSPPILGPIFEYNAESDDENNDQRQNFFGRRSFRGRDGNVIRSWVMMNNYFQPRPLFIGQGDSKAMDGPFTLQRVPLEEQQHNGPDRADGFDLSRIPRPIHRNQRNDRRQQRNFFQAQA